MTIAVRSHCKNIERLDLTDLLGKGLSPESLQAAALVQPQVLDPPFQHPPSRRGVVGFRPF